MCCVFMLFLLICSLFFCITQRSSMIPGSKPILLDLEKLFLLSDSMGNLDLYGKIEISEPAKIWKKWISWFPQVFMDPRLGTDTSGPGEAVFTIRFTGKPQFEWKNWNFRTLKHSNKIVLRFLRLEIRFQTWESGSDDEISRRIRFWSQNWAIPASRGEKI